MNILVAGATGHTGRHVARTLAARGHNVVALARSPDAALRLFGESVSIRKGDVRDPASLEVAFAGIDVVINTTGTRTFWGDNGGHAVDIVGSENIANAAVHNRVGHLILLSAFGLDRSSIFLTLFSRMLNGYFECKVRAERAHIQSTVPYTIVRPVELLNGPPRGHALLNQEAPLSLLRFVSRELVAQVLAECVDNGNAVGKTFEVCESKEQGDDLRAQIASMKPDHARNSPPNTPLF